MMFFDPMYFLIIGPAFLLAFWAQMRVKSTYAQAQRVPAQLSGAAAARHILNSAGLDNVEIEMTRGQLTDHYDPRHKVLRLSEDVYHSRSAAAVGIAAHEAGHAIQDARAYTPLVIRNAAVPLAGFGSNFAFMMVVIGAIFSTRIEALGILIPIGIALFGCVVFFQLVNLPVEFNASRRAKQELAALAIVDDQGMVYVNKVLSAAAMTYVAATLQAILTMLYLIWRYTGRN